MAAADWTIASLVGCLLLDFKADQRGSSFGNILLFYENVFLKTFNAKKGYAVAESVFISDR